MTQHIIKIVWEATNEIRKIQVDEDKQLDGVIEKVRNLFGICKIGSDEEPNIRLWYIDNHGDAIYVSTSEELRIGLRSTLHGELVLFGSLLQRNQSSDQSGNNQSERYEIDASSNQFFFELMQNASAPKARGNAGFDWKIYRIRKQGDQCQGQSNETNQKSESQFQSQSSEKKKEREKTKDEQLLWNAMFEDFGLEAERQGSQNQEKEKEKYKERQNDIIIDIDLGFDKEAQKSKNQEKEKEKNNKQQQSDEHRQNNNSEYEYPQMWHQFGDMALQFLNQMNKNRSNGFEQQNFRSQQDQIGQHDRTEDFLAWEGIRQQQIQAQTQTQQQQQSSSSSSTSIPIEFAKGSSVEGQNGSEYKVEEKKE
ncbi:MAG: hypothetical protein EZS28_006018 [Streblomastix strix]|uniref:AXH domain-containing protein n=1 Tax=Streblomastix strix TaxID=222440 RepID=A0A5J4WVR5_9EUKA|nr:MAG: hypothetical protein EZS28_006018 [Streblomastix strix]